MMTSFSGYWLPRAGEQLLQTIPGRSDTRRPIPGEHVPRSAAYGASRGRTRRKASWGGVWELAGGLEPPTCCLQDRSGSSAACWRVLSWQFRSGGSSCLGDRAVAGVALGGDEVGCCVGAAAAAEAIRARPAGEPVAAAAAAQAVVAGAAGQGVATAVATEQVVAVPARQG